MLGRMIVTGCTLVVWLQEEAARAQGIARWGREHVELVATLPGVDECRQHQFARDTALDWPAPEGVETRPAPGAAPDGIWEMTGRHALRLFVGSFARGRSAQETLRAQGLHLTGLGDVHARRRAVVTEAARAVVLLRRREHVAEREWSRFVTRELLAVLEHERDLEELGAQLFSHPAEELLEQAGLAGHGPKYDAMLVLGARDAATLAAVLSRPALRASFDAQRRCLAAAHAFAVERTFTLVREGRRLLPTSHPTRKLAIAPVVWHPPPAPERARKTHSAEPFPPARLITLPARAPEDVVVDSEGHLLCGVHGGRILSVDPRNGSARVLGDTEGRPLGLEVLEDGRVLVCDAHRGLLRLDPRTGNIEVLVEAIAGVPLRFCSNAAAARDGTIWFSESTSRFDFEQYPGDLLEHRGAGRLFRRDANGAVDVVLSGLHFANGVALNADESAVIFAETAAYQMSRVPTQGPDAGRRSVITPNLPGFPDNISRAPDGTIWVTLPTARDPQLDALSPRAPLLRKAVWALPDRLRPAYQRTVWVIAIDEQGTIVRDLQAQRDDFCMVTGVVEHERRLYLAGLAQGALLELDLRATHK